MSGVVSVTPATASPAKRTDDTTPHIAFDPESAFVLIRADPCQPSLLHGLAHRDVLLDAVRVVRIALPHMESTVLNIGKLVGEGSATYYLDKVTSGVEDYYLHAGESPGMWLTREASRLGLFGNVAADTPLGAPPRHASTDG